MRIPKEIIDRLSGLDCEEVAQMLGLKVVRHKAHCFMHADKTPSMSFFEKNRKAWNCFACRKGGNAIHLVRDYYGLGFIEACAWLCSQYNINIEGWNNHQRRYGKLSRVALTLTPEKEDKAQYKFDANVVSAMLRHCKLTPEAEVFLFEHRHLSPDVIRRIGILGISESSVVVKFLSSKFSEEVLTGSGIVTKTNGKLYLRFWTPCVIFPYRDIDGNLIGIQTRYIGFDDSAPRFQFISGFKTSLFNLPEIKDMKDGEVLYISEGITDCLALLSSGKKAVAVPSASILPEIDLWRLRHFNLRMYPDNDEAGNKAYENVLDMMVGFSSYVHRENLPSDFKDYSDYYLSQMEKDGK